MKYTNSLLSVSSLRWTVSCDTVSTHWFTGAGFWLISPLFKYIIFIDLLSKSREVQYVLLVFWSLYDQISGVKVRSCGATWQWRGRVMLFGIQSNFLLKTRTLLQLPVHAGGTHTSWGVKVKCTQHRIFSEPWRQPVSVYRPWFLIRWKKTRSDNTRSCLRHYQQKPAWHLNRCYYSIPQGNVFLHVLKLQ